MYRYVGNRPTNATDPSGLDTIWIEGVEYYLPDGWDKEKYVNLLRTDPYIAELARVKNEPEYRGPVIQAATGPELTAEEKDLEYRFQLLEMGWLNNAGKTKLYNDSRRYLHNKLSEQAGLCWFSKWSTDIQFGVTNEGQAIATLIQPRPAGLRWKTVPIGTSGVKYPVRGPAPNGPVHIDIGGEGRYPRANNVNPNTTTSTTGTPGRVIPNRVPGRGEKLPFPDRHADGISLENTPLSAQTAAEIVRVIKPGGSIRLQHWADYASETHSLVTNAIPNCTVNQVTKGGYTITTITVPR